MYITELILVLRNLKWYFGAHTGISDLIRVLQNLYSSYGTYTGVTKLILIFQILFMCEGTRRYNKSEHIILMQIHIRYGH